MSLLQRTLASTRPAVAALARCNASPMLARSAPARFLNSSATSLQVEDPQQPKYGSFADDRRRIFCLFCLLRVFPTSLAMYLLNFVIVFFSYPEFKILRVDSPSCWKDHPGSHSQDCIDFCSRAWMDHHLDRKSRRVHGISLNYSRHVPQRRSRSH